MRKLLVPIENSQYFPNAEINAIPDLMCFNIYFTLEYNCNPNIPDEDGKTALHLCATELSSKKEECAKLLKEITKPDIPS